MISRLLLLVWRVQTGESEDRLVLNVWTPALRDGRKRPVMVWFHGGGATMVFNVTSKVVDDPDSELHKILRNT